MKLRAGERVFEFPSVLNCEPASTALGAYSRRRSTADSIPIPPETQAMIRKLIHRILDLEWVGWTVLGAVALLVCLGIVQAAELLLMVLP